MTSLPIPRAIPPCRLGPPFWTYLCGRRSFTPWLLFCPPGSRRRLRSFFAYLASILRAERKFDDSRWVAYDRCYCREALSQKNLDWLVPNARLYNEAFTGRARTVPQCNYCLQEDHVAQSCPRNPNRPWFGWLSHGPNNRGLGPSR